jgi:aminoglycoside phosphotransferase (APT) family kinase protein
MLLNSDSVVHYLLHRGFLDRESVIGGELTVLEAPRRNRNFKVVQQHKPGIFVKQVQEWDPQAIATVQREAWCYSLARTVPEMAALNDLLPGFRFFDSQRNLIVLDLLSGFESLAEYHQRLGAFPVEMAEAMASALGSYHRQTRDKLANLPEASIFPKMTPWVLSIHLQQPTWFQSLSAANAQLLEIVKKYDQFATTLDKIRGHWNHSALVHGDIKWDNCLVQPSSEANGKLQFKVIDWELADLGDPLWDAGAVLQSYLSYWILSMPIWPGARAEEFIAKSPHSLSAFQAAIRAFWNRYREAAGIPGAERKEALARSIGYGAARMVQTAYEALTYATQINLNATYLLQVSMNILLEPEEATTELFGIAEA